MWRLDGVRPRVLVTGIGGPAAQAFIASFAPGTVDWFAADMDPLMPGFQLFPPDRRGVLPRGGDQSFARALLSLALTAGADVVVPTVDSELLAVARSRRHFSRQGIHVLAASVSTLDVCLDKLHLVEKLSGVVDVPVTHRFDESFDPAGLKERVVVKPRSGSGGRGVHVFEAAAEISADLPRDGSLIVQEFLPGAEYSIDVLAGKAGRIVAAVPRERIRVDSGIAVVARSVRDQRLIDFGTAVAEAIGLTTAANVQAKLREDGTPALLEVNPRFPGTMSLTVASGVNMPELALTDLLGGVIPERAAFRETVMVRTWADHIVDPASYGRSGLGASDRVA